MTVCTPDDLFKSSDTLLNSDNDQALPLRYPVICIDGPSGAGKGTVTWRLAQALGYQLLDSGALYRIVGLKAFEAGLISADVSQAIDEMAVLALTKSLDIAFVPNNESGCVDIIVNGEAVGEQVRNETVGGYASQVAVFPKVRQALLKLQQDMATRSGLVADGRDMGTVVFPDADVKVFLTASAEARAKRRVMQLVNAGQIADFETILATIKARDDRDENRATAPSKPAKDALLLDSSTLDADMVYEQIKKHCQEKGIVFIH
ncbi:(d)CMP kinase [Psychrobacter aquaticus]|uniref:Cytidylate kinase n=1 Tax=Psychrobacter aquaticus CMS 56 TaxID=1354303 RepID=U4T8J4_9GAMM|nr:(d)CMP kinase [Psychrobacter aquaticus]ERL55034.1 Cytidylate kinase [Psychrobacter aquaticus CMS 56]